MGTLTYVIGWILLAMLIASTALVLPPLLVAGSWFAGWLDEHHHKD